MPDVEQVLSRAVRQLGQAWALARRIRPLRRFRRGGPYSPPLKAKFFVTHRCDLRCRHCNLWEKKGGPAELDTAEYRRIFERNPALRVISFSGGEPSLRPDLAELIILAARTRPGPAVLSVNLNGYASDATVAALREALDHLPDSVRLIASISLDGPAEVHDAIRRQPGAHARALETARRLAAWTGPGFQVRRNLCISPFNAHGLEPVLRDARAEGTGLQICFYQVTDHYHHQAEHRALLPGFRDEMRARMAAIRRLAPAPDPIGRVFLDLAETFYRRPSPRQVLPCYSGLAAVSCDPSGEIHPCINFKRSMGQLRECDYRLDRLLASPAAARVRARIADDACPGCWTPNEAYTTILCNLPDPGLAAAWLRARLGAWPGGGSVR